jgi:two-component system, OmpR family, KDP operon response regulator KdpE
MPSVLVVEDDQFVRSALIRHLTEASHTVRSVGTALEALREVAHFRFDVVILDLGLPDLDGVDVITGLRGWSSVPILVLSGRADSVDKVSAFDAGADDYVTKPFGMDELLARLRAMLRRTAPTTDQPTVEFGEICIDLAATRVTRRGEEVRLTPTEWRLLELLVRHPGRLISQRQILEQVWGPGYENAQGNLRLYVAQLRRKLEEEPSRPLHLRTEPGMGYRFEL